ncbi:MAG: hypothetical protein AB2794_06065 [Candidatus Thiodiazotropha endolucinida]
MYKSMGFVLGSLLAMPLPTFAFHYPMDMKKIDVALTSNPNLNPEQLAEVQKLRAEGEAYHRAGRYDRSVQVLGQAMKILRIQ